MSAAEKGEDLIYAGTLHCQASRRSGDGPSANHRVNGSAKSEAIHCEPSAGNEGYVKITAAGGELFV
jgi:hypothetical protein